MSNPTTFQDHFMFYPFQYDQVSLSEATQINGTPYFTRRAIGEWLEYTNPQKAIDNIVARNPHLSNSEWAVPLKLRVTQSSGKSEHTPQTEGYAREVEMEIYNPIGLQLIVFESRQPKAIQYKIAVAKLVNDIMTGEYNKNLCRRLLGEMAARTN